MDIKVLNLWWLAGIVDIKKVCLVTRFHKFGIINLQNCEPVMVTEVFMLIYASLFDLDRVDANVVIWDSSF
jgi:hypothetical protein